MRRLFFYLKYFVNRFFRCCVREKIFIKGNPLPLKTGDEAINAHASNLSVPASKTLNSDSPKLSLVNSQEVKAIDSQWLRGFIKKHDIGIEPRDYQERIVVKAINLILINNVSSILIESATGSGKTVIGLLISKILKELLGHGTSWCTMRRNLLVQTEKADREYNFCVSPSFVSMFDKNPRENDVLIVDEAHHDSTTSMSNIHSKTNPRVTILLSATPIRADKATIFYQKCIKDSGIRALIRDNWLSQFDHYTIDEWTPQSVANCYLREPQKWGKSCVFFHKYEQCLEFQRILLQSGVECELVTGKSDRDSQLERFESGEVKVLVNMMVLTEGFDAPSLQSVFVRDSYRGTTVQMAGRVLRKFHNTTKNIIQSKFTRYPFTREASASAKYVWDEDEGWKELGTNPLIDQIVADSLQQLAARASDETSRPTKLIEHLKKKRLTSRKRNPWGFQ